MDKLRIHQGTGGEKLLCSAEERTGHSPAAQVDRILAADEALAEVAVSPDVRLGGIFDRIGPPASCRFGASRRNASWLKAIAKTLAASGLSA